MEELILHLKKQVDAFTTIPEKEWRLLTPFIKLKTLQKKELFIEEGRQETVIGFVVNGMFRQYYSKDGEEKTTYFFFENHFISSYISCITRQP